MMIEAAIRRFMEIWPLGFTKPEIEKEIDGRVSIMELRKLRAIENTGVRRNKFVVWRYKPYQLALPFGGTDASSRTQ